MGGKSPRRSASSQAAEHAAETPGTYGSAPAPENGEVPSDAVDLFNPPRPLSAEERAVFTYGLAGKKNNEIAIIMRKSKRTVEKQMASALGKVGVEDREAAVVLYHRLREARSDGENRELREQLAARDAAIKARDATIEARDATIEARDATIEALRRKLRRRS